MLTRLFITNLHDSQVTLVGVTFTISPAIIADAFGIPNMGGKWFKQGELDHFYYEPYLKPRYKNERKRIFPFSYHLDRYIPMMKIIMKYFTCEVGFPGSIPIIFGYSCIPQDSKCSISPTIFTGTLTRSHSLPKGRIMIIKCKSYFTTASSK